MAQKKVALIGCGYISETHLRAWAKTSRCRVAGVLDTNRELAEKRAREHGVPRVYADLAQAIEECDVVDVCTPPQSHAAIATAVVEAGRYLVIEKPLVTDVTDWDRIQAAAGRSGAQIAVVHNQKFGPSVRRAHELVAHGRIGRLIGVTIEFMTDPSTDRMLVGDSHWSHRLPGGRWFEVLPHGLYHIHSFMGTLDLASVNAVRTASALPGTPADEVVVVFAGAAGIATIRYSASCGLNKRFVTLHGTEGEIILDILGRAATVIRARERRWQRPIGMINIRAAKTLAAAVADRGHYLGSRVRGESPHAVMIQAVEDHLEGRGEAPTSLEEIDFVVRQGDAIGRRIDAAGAGGTPTPLAAYAGRGGN